MKNLAIIISVVASIVVSACGISQESKQLDITVTKKEEVKLPISPVCHKDGLNPFKPVAKGKDETPAVNLAHALQSNKSRMARNEVRVALCECYQAQANGNEQDKKRLEKQCSAEQMKLAEEVIAKTVVKGPAKAGNPQGDRAIPAQPAKPSPAATLQPPAPPKPPIKG